MCEHLLLNYKDNKSEAVNTTTLGYLLLNKMLTLSSIQ